MNKLGIISLLLYSSQILTSQSVHIDKKDKTFDKSQHNVTNLILNPQDINANNKKPTQSLTAVKKFQSISAVRNKFRSRKSVFDQAKDEILQNLDKEHGKEKTLLGLGESSDGSIEISEIEQNEHIFSGFQLFHLRTPLFSDKSSIKSDQKTNKANPQNTEKDQKKENKDQQQNQQQTQQTLKKAEKPVISLTTLQRPPDAGQLVGQQAEISLDLKDDQQQKVILESLRDSLYLGTIHIGTPHSQPIQVAFDTGSEFLAITSSLCSDQTTPARFKFKKFDPVHNSLVDSTNTTSRCLNQGFDIDKSTSAKITSNRAQKVNYGSAELDGFIFEDYTCLQAIPQKKLTKKEIEMPSLMQSKLKDSKCSPFEFLTLYEAKGLADEFHGILGLSPKKNEALQKQHYLWALREYGLIDRAMVSFSITQSDMQEPPYALFGGYNSTQIVNGHNGLKVFKNYQSDFKSWALLGQGMLYDGKYFTDLSHPGYSALIDTGSSQLTVPPAVFRQMQARWQEDIPNIQCKPQHTFCHVLDSCTNVVKKLKPIAFQLSDFIFQINPDEYLQEARKDACFFVIHKTDVDETDAANIYLIGDLFLKHFYSVYDFDKDEVSLGINTHSKDKAQMFSPAELQNKK